MCITIIILLRNLLFQESKLLAINDGKELLLYGGRVAADVDAIWKFTVADSTWKQVRLG